MRLQPCTRLAGTRWLVAMLITVGVPWSARAQDKPTQQTTVAVTPAEPKPSLEIYGFAMLDIGHDFKQINPNWYDTLRVTRLPSFDKQFGENHNTFAGVRQSRLGVRSSTPTPVGELKTIFEFELFGTGVDEGQTTFRLRHAWGELGRLGAGQYWSPFSDPDVYPNTLEYWGPTGIPWFRNVQLRYTPISTDHSNFMLALARPGASGDQGVYADRIELDGIRARFPLPDFAAAYKFSGDWGYVRTAGMLRRINWDDTLDDAFDLSGDATGWGWNVSSNLKHGEGDVLRMQFTVGEGIQNEMNDSPVDIGIARNLSDPVRPLVGEPDTDRRSRPSSWITSGATPSAPRSATRGRRTTTPMPRHRMRSRLVTTRSATSSTIPRRT